MPRLTQVAHIQLADAIKPGAYVIDATAGNGHDTLFLAESVGPTGHVLAIDRQASALAKTSERLAKAELLDRATLIEGNHADLLQQAPDTWRAQVAAVVFNLGYLPGANKSLITTATTTGQALDASLTLLAPNGLLSVLIYRGHDGGHDEEAMILAWLDEHSAEFAQIKWNDGDFPTETSPRLLNATKA